MHYVSLFKSSFSAISMYAYEFEWLHEHEFHGILGDALAVVIRLIVEMISIYKEDYIDR